MHMIAVLLFGVRGLLSCRQQKHILDSAHFVSKVLACKSSHLVYAKKFDSVLNGMCLKHVQTVKLSLFADTACIILYEPSMMCNVFLQIKYLKLMIHLSLLLELMKIVSL